MMPARRFPPQHSRDENGMASYPEPGTGRSRPRPTESVTPISQTTPESNGCGTFPPQGIVAITAAAAAAEAAGRSGESLRRWKYSTKVEMNSPGAAAFGSESTAMESAAPSPSESRLWQAWLAEHGEWFFLYARQQTRSESDAKDVFQESLFETWRRADGSVPDKALVIATIRRRAIDLGRSADRRARRESDFGDTEVPWFVSDFEAGDTRDFLASAVRELPENLREVVVLRVWGELSFRSIAELTGVPVPTATSRYRYALERLRGCLTELQP